MKKEWMRFLIVAAGLLLVLPNLACQKAAEDADATATEMTDTAGEQTEAAAVAVDETVEQGAEAIGDVIEDGTKAVEEAADAVDTAAKDATDAVEKKAEELEKK
jgi:hypothetical protein